MADSGDSEERTRAVGAAERAGDHAEAVRLLLDGMVHLNGHDEGQLPCLCKRCLDPKRTQVEVGGIDYLRSWAIARGRVLFFWAPDSLQDDLPRLRRAVAAGMHRRLRKLR